MSLRFFVYVVSLILCFISCQTSQESEMKGIPVVMNTNASIEDFLVKMDMICLETNENCLLGSITKICVDEECYYLKDEFKRSVFLFAKSGDYISKISQYGSGPNEYLEVSDFEVKNGQIFILSNPNKKILVFDKMGECLKTIRLNDWYHHLAVEEDRILLHSGKSNDQYYNIIAIDYNGNVLDKYLPFEKNNNFRYNESPFKNEDNGNYLLTFPYDGRIVSLSDGKCMYKYKIDFEAKVTFSDKDLDKLTYEEIRKRSLYKNCMKRINSVSELNEDYLYVVTTAYYNGEGERQALCKINVKDGSSKFYKLGERLEVEYPYLSNIIKVENGKMYSFIFPSLKKTIDEYLGKDSENKVAEDANPILCIYTIKTV